MKMRADTPNPTPSARQFYEALVALFATGEPQIVGSTLLRPDREWPTSSTALWGLAIDLAKAEPDATTGVAA